MLYSYRHISRQVNACPYTLAAPSWVWPGTVAENCVRLAGIFPEVALIFLESEPCLGYSGQDLPPSLAGLPLKYHVHLPVDLDWREPRSAFEVCAALADKVAFLSPGAYVLHPPAGKAAKRRKLLGEFADMWRHSGHDAGSVLLENTREAGPDEIAAIARKEGFGLCLDLGHIMAYEQALPALPDTAGLVRMVHLNAPGPNAEHLPLTQLGPEGRSTARGLIELCEEDAVLVLEIFEPRGLMESAQLTARWIEEWNLR